MKKIALFTTLVFSLFFISCTATKKDDGMYAKIITNKGDIVLSLHYDKLNNVKNDDFILLVTHQVVISEITKISPPSGGIVIYNTINKKAKLIRNITN